MKSKIIRTRSKLERVALGLWILLFAVNAAGYLLGTGFNDNLAYVSVGLFVMALVFNIASKFYGRNAKSSVATDL